MQPRPLGKSGLSVAPFAFGGNVFGWTADEATSFRLLDAFVEAGFTLIDTADMYSRWAPGNQGGESETIIGNWLARSGKRDKVVVATKVGMEMAPGRTGLAPAYIRKSVEESLKRLRTDTIDLYQAHQDDPSTPLEDTLGAFADLVREGKVRVLGASNYSAPRLAEALAVSAANGWPRYETLQPPYNLYDRASFESELQPLCVREGIGVITYYSLASGFLTGKYRSKADSGKSPRGGGAMAKLNERGLRILAALDEVAAQHPSTPAAVALAWLMTRPTIAAPIASATSVEQLRELTAAAALDLDAAALARLEEASR